ncbi:hypothetical protein SALBM311S_03708 [Streptomyces alboniger]
MVCGWFGCWSSFTAVIFSPSKVTWTSTGPFSVSTVVPVTTREEEPPEEDVEGAGVETWVPADVAVDGS